MSMTKNKWIPQEVGEISAYVLLGLIMTIVIPVYIGFAMGGFEESIQSGEAITIGSILGTYMLYYIFIIVALIGLPMLKVREMFITNRGEHPANQSNPRLFSVGIIHDPQQDGLLYNAFDGLGLKGNKNPMRWSNSYLRMFALGILIFSIIGIMQLFTGFSFVGLPQQVPQQLTDAGKVFFSAEPPAFAETGLILLVFMLLLGIGAWISSKFKLGKIGYYTMGVVSAIISSIIWLGYHNIVYGSSSVAMTYTLVFGFVGCLMTLLLGSFIWFYLFHFANNFYIALGNQAIIREDTILFAIIGIAVYTLIYVSAEVLLYKYKKKKAPIESVPS